LFNGTRFHHFRPLLDKWLSEDLERIYSLLGSGDHGFFHSTLEELGIRYRCTSEDLARIPVQGPAIVISNHPFGLADPLILGALLSDVRKDFRFLANSFLEAVPQLERYIFPVNPFGGANAVRGNSKAIRRSIEWLKAGGLLVVFPAGEVASMRLPDLGISDPEWNPSVARLLVRTGASAIPVFFHGTNSPIFHLAGLLHPNLRTVLLPHELLNKAGTEIHVAIGKPILPERLARIPGFRDATEYLRTRTYLLEGRGRQLPPARLLFSSTRWRPAKLAAAKDPSVMEREIESLPIECRLVSTGEYVASVAPAEQIPTTLLEIGRLRELTFRGAGEGTGQAIDLDVFDRHYEHLLLWNREKREIVGAYRLARTDEILERMGARGLYTSTLFQLHPNFYNAVYPALELGRSFVRPEYQKGYLPLLLLWKGLAHFVAANPRYRILFGPVSISKDYSPSSRALMAGYLKSRPGGEDLAAYVKPRQQFRVRSLSGCDPRIFGSLLSKLDDLSELVTDLEADHKGIPILIQQYLNLGGQILEFSVDRRFSNVLDGLILVDLVKASRSKLERYMGKNNARDFLEYHGVHA
jgi:putative hemolysin